MWRMPPRERPRRGACWGSRRAKACAAACLASVLLALGAPGPAAAYRCEDPPPPVSLPHPELPAQAPYASPTSTECQVPDDERAAARTKKRGSVSGLTVFVLAIAAALLIPIGARGIPSSVDPYSDDSPFR
jgi:hypothetical protein